jgi:hypothetical protein
VLCRDTDLAAGDRGEPRHLGLETGESRDRSGPLALGAAPLCLRADGRGWPF